MAQAIDRQLRDKLLIQPGDEAGKGKASAEKVAEEALAE